MTLKESTYEKHKLAEQSVFMKKLFSGQLPIDYWADFIYQKSLIYNVIERLAEVNGLLSDLKDIKKTHDLYNDYMDLTDKNFNHCYRNVTIDYYKYILALESNVDAIMAHMYVWHMGDLFGGQMIKKLVPGPHRSLTFKNTETLKNSIRAKLKDSMAVEANIAFDWAIKLLNDYEFTTLE